MTGTTVFTTYRTWETQKSNPAKAEGNPFSVEKKVCYTEEAVTSGNISELLSQTAMSMNNFAHSPYKAKVMLEPAEIDKIKSSLSKFTSDDKKAIEFKKEIINDLTNLQNQIKENYMGRIQGLYTKKETCERQIKVLEDKKYGLIKERLAKIEWPYDEKTKACDVEIARLKVLAQQYQQKMEYEQQMRPAANEKDILLYQLKQKEKYSQMGLIFS